MRMHAKRYDRTEKLRCVPSLDKTSDERLLRMCFIVLYFVAIGSFTADVGLLQPTRGVKTTSKDPFSQCESLQGIRVQVKN